MNTISATATSIRNSYSRPTLLTGENKQPGHQPPTDKKNTDEGVTNTKATVVTKQTPSQTKTPEVEQQLIAELAARDAQVRTHEAAHKAAGGNLTGPASFTYQTGPNGKRYAIGGEVSVDTSPVAGDPQATLLKASRIRAAATAPAQPSAQDNSVAASASAMAGEARAQISLEKQRESKDENKVNNETEKKPNADSRANTTAEQDTETTSRPNTQAQQTYRAASINMTETNHGRHIDITV